VRGDLMRRGMAGAGSSDRAPIAVTQRGEADVKAAIARAGLTRSPKPTQALPIRRQRRGLGQCFGMTPEIAAPRSPAGAPHDPCHEPREAKEEQSSDSDVEGSENRPSPAPAVG